MIKENNNVDFWISTYNDKLIAGIITIKYHKRIYYWASMLNRDFSKMCPINGLLYNAIKFYEKMDLIFLILGLVPRGKGVTHFKKNFGCTKSIFYDVTYKSARYKYIIEPLINFGSNEDAWPYKKPFDFIKAKIFCLSIDILILKL